MAIPADVLALDYAKRVLGVVDGAYDAQIEDIVEAAIESVQLETSLAIKSVEATDTDVVIGDDDKFIILKNSNVEGDVTISFEDEDMEDVVISADRVLQGLRGEKVVNICAKIKLLNTDEWLEEARGQPLTLTYTSGMEADTIPKWIKTRISDIMVLKWQGSHTQSAQDVRNSVDYTQYLP